MGFALLRGADGASAIAARRAAQASWNRARVAAWPAAPGERSPTGERTGPSPWPAPGGPPAIETGGRLFGPAGEAQGVGLPRRQAGGGPRVEQPPPGRSRGEQARQSRRQVIRPEMLACDQSFLQALFWQATPVPRHHPLAPEEALSARTAPDSGLLLLLSSARCLQLVQPAAPCEPRRCILAQVVRLGL